MPCQRITAIVGKPVGLCQGVIGRFFSMTVSTGRFTRVAAQEEREPGTREPAPFRRRVADVVAADGDTDANKAES